MIINMTDPHMGIFAGITIFDNEGKPMSLVQEIDTETLSCTVGSFGKKVQAAGFILEHNAAMVNYIPDGLIPHVYPGKNPTKGELQGFIQFHLNHRQEFFDTATKYLEDFKAYQSSPVAQIRKTWRERHRASYFDGLEETFSWPREPFKAMVKDVMPSEEEDLAAAEEAEKHRWGKGVMVCEEKFHFVGAATLPWGGDPKAMGSHGLKKLWLRTDSEGTLANWGFAVDPAVSFAVPNTVIEIGNIRYADDNEEEWGEDRLPIKLKHRLFDYKWEVYATRGKEDGTIELLLREKIESPVENLPSFVPEGDTNK